MQCISNAPYIRHVVKTSEELMVLQRERQQKPDNRGIPSQGLHKVSGIVFGIFFDMLCLTFPIDSAFVRFMPDVNIRRRLFILEREMFYFLAFPFCF